MAKFLGIDTSCYTTSAAVYDSTEGIVGESRIILSVKAGKRGLSQSEMVFQHVRNLPVILGQLEPWIDQINGIGVSVFPRRRADSYMPAFLVGKGMAKSLSYVLRVPVFEFSHQENHALAAIQNMPEIWGTPFYMMHLSGGTQDVLSVEWEKDIMQIVDLIHSADITAGQFIDRVGVSLGMPFPAGPSMERLAMKHQQLYKVPVANIENGFSFAGPEAQVQRDIQTKRYAPEDIAYGVFSSIDKSLHKVLNSYNGFIEGRTFIAVGGVMSNGYLRKSITEICRYKSLHPRFAEVKYSSDNATGNAFGAFMRYTYESLLGS